MMKIQLTVTLILLSVLYCCRQSTPDNVMDGKAIEEKLETIATEFLRSWEPPYNPEKALSLFTESNDFQLISDGHETSEYVDWAYLVPKWMDHDAHAYSSYSHTIQNIEAVTLSPQSGVVTATYIWDSISKEGVHARIIGAITLTCRLEGNAWKIVHYHGSHYEPDSEE